MSLVDPTRTRGDPVDQWRICIDRIRARSRNPMVNIRKDVRIGRQEDEEDFDDERDRGGRSKSRGRKGRGRRTSKSKSAVRDGKSKTCGRRRRKGDDTEETSMEMTWSLITLAAHLSQTVGNIYFIVDIVAQVPRCCRSGYIAIAKDGGYPRKPFRGEEFCSGTCLSQTSGP